jgi:hypothetical protein
MRKIIRKLLRSILQGEGRKLLTALGLGAALIIAGCENNSSRNAAKAQPAPPQPAPETVAGYHSATLAEQKMCAEQAKKAFDEYERQPLPSGMRHTSHDYTSHYDPKLNTCYVLLEMTDFMTDTKTESLSYTLLDAFERRDFAHYVWFSEQIRPRQLGFAIKSTSCNPVTFAALGRNFSSLLLNRA